ncbi:MFS transporter [Streptomyces sp. ME19-01-6]|uniref:MFS transporter n=1 Tax=Streptomyces sp. ME19-01-6 TaxID=3028686 RepID=UPI0029B635A8|nr:MFS transporter [Streptomyces sp. ME19-01-6]MDX3226292.1 MFS transporter [Streptomyces sp. ME19-01-6]
MNLEISEAGEPLSITARPGPRGTGTDTGTSDGRARPIPVLWLALLATPVAAGANAPVLILDDMSRSLGVGTATAAWLVTAFAWAMTVAMPLLATLLRRRGARMALRVGAGLVLGGSVVLVASPWLPLTLLGRAAQAAGGAGLIAVAMSLAGNARRMGVISAGFGMLGAAGPLLGERITEAVSWRAALAVSVVALLAVPAVGRHVTQAPPAEGRFDTRGALLLSALATGVILLPSYPLPAVGAAVGATVLLALHIRRRPEGFVPSAVLRTPVFRIGTLLALTLSTSYFVLLFAVPRLIAGRAGWSTGAVATGQLVALLTGSALALGFAAVSARLGRTRVRAVLLTVGVLAAATAAWAHSAPALLAAAGAAVFCATGANATQSMDAASAVPAAQRPTAIGLFTLGYQLGGALGPALATLLVLG